MELEASYALLRNATDEKIRLSRDQLLEAERYRERTAALIERTSQQLLLEESMFPLLVHGFNLFCTAYLQVFRKTLSYALTS